MGGPDPFLCQLLIEHLSFFLAVEVVGIDKLVLYVFVVCPELVEHLLCLILQTLEVGRKFPFEVYAEEHRLVHLFQQGLGRLGQIFF